MDLRQRPLEVEPVERGCGGDRVGGRSRAAGARSAEPASTSTPGTAASSCVPHLRQRLDGDHGRAGRDELPRQLAGARAEIDDRRARPEPEPFRRASRPPRAGRSAGGARSSRRPSRRRAAEERSNSSIRAAACRARPGASSPGSRCRARSTSSRGSRSRAARGRRTTGRSGPRSARGRSCRAARSSASRCQSSSSAWSRSGKRARADEAHLAAEDVEHVRELVDREAPQEPPDATSRAGRRGS